MACYLDFVFQGIPPKMKTGIWQVVTNDSGTYLGDVRWFSRWRRYCFFPVDNTVFEEVCLRDIAEFVELRTKDHRAARKAA